MVIEVNNRNNILVKNRGRDFAVFILIINIFKFLYTNFGRNILHCP